MPLIATGREEVGDWVGAGVGEEVAGAGAGAELVGAGVQFGSAGEAVAELREAVAYAGVGEFGGAWQASATRPAASAAQRASPASAGRIRPKRRSITLDLPPLQRPEIMARMDRLGRLRMRPGGTLEPRARGGTGERVSILAASAEGGQAEAEKKVHPKKETADGMKGFVDDIGRLTKGNADFRRVLYTSHHLQLVLMTLPPGGEIGSEVHKDRDQFFRVEAGDGEITIDGTTHRVTADFAMIVPAGARHNVRSVGSTPLKLYTLYGPPNHLDGVVRATKADADAEPEHFDGKTTE